MYTMAALVQNGRTFLLRNTVVKAPGEWRAYLGEAGEVPYCALVTGAAERIDVGLNREGLALLCGASPATDDLVHAALARALSQCRDVKTALAQITECLAPPCELSPGHILLADGTCVVALEYGAGQVEQEIVADGFIARSDRAAMQSSGSPLQKSEVRYERMVEFVEGLYAWMPILDGEDVIERCRAVLRQEPLCDAAAISSVVVELEDGRVDYLFEVERWQTTWLSETLS
jgi:hypothetical protein